jgi:hypothetical protein
MPGGKTSGVLFQRRMAPERCISAAVSKQWRQASPSQHGHTSRADANRPGTSTCQHLIIELDAEPCRLLVAARQPVLVVYEDLHRIDPTSLELMSLAIEEIGGGPVVDQVRDFRGRSGDVPNSLGAATYRHLLGPVSLR